MNEESRSDAERMLDDLFPYRRVMQTFRRIPDRGVDRSAVLTDIAGMAKAEDAVGDSGRVSGSLYSGDHDHYHFLAEVFEQFAHANVLQRDMYPSATKFEGEIIAMVAELLNDPQPIGVVTSGGSDSLVHALYSYREQAREERGIRTPNIVLPVTAHVALRKGAHWLGIDVRDAPLAADYRADVDAMADLIDSDTIAIAGSAGDYAHGLIDPIAELGALAQERGVGLHVDGCLGGLLLPWAEELGYDVPLWDFRVPGVTSISADTHKYGYGLKGTSVLLYRDAMLRSRQWFSATEWPGGLYLSPGLAGSRSGGLIASTWAAMVTTGRGGYLDKARAILSTNDTIKSGIRAGIPELQVIGDPVFMTSFMSAPEADIDVYLVNDALKARGWRMNSLQIPPALHFCVTGPNTQAGVSEDFLGDLRAAVDYAVEHRGEPAQSGAMYGFGATPQGQETLTVVMNGVLDAMHVAAPDA
jgi:glutamate/tyrosine decarboxylase-like PLP-dependent enzyme